MAADHIYVVECKCTCCGHVSVKVGVSTWPKFRIGQLRGSNPNRLTVKGIAAVQRAHKLETYVRSELKSSRSDGGREWFGISGEDAWRQVLKTGQSLSLVLQELDTSEFVAYPTGDEVRSAREGQRWSLRELSDRTGHIISASAIGSYEIGNTHRPHPKTMDAIVLAFRNAGVTFEQPKRIPSVGPVSAVC